MQSSDYLQNQFTTILKRTKMKKLLLLVLTTLALTAQAQTSKDHWHGYPPQRQVSAVVGGLVGSTSYAIIRASSPNDPKWKSILYSSIFTTVTSAAIYTMYNISSVDKRQNFTASMASGIGVTLVFSLGT